MRVRGYWRDAGLMGWGGFLLGETVEVALTPSIWMIGFGWQGKFASIYIGPVEVQWWPAHRRRERVDED